MRFYRLKYTFDDSKEIAHQKTFPDLILARDLLEAKHTLKRLLNKMGIDPYNIRLG